MERKSAIDTKNELERSRRELEQFVYMASHDLQEPLRMVTNFTRLLAQKYRGRLDADADEFISYAVDGATRVQRFIESMLSYSRVTITGQEGLIPADCEYIIESAIANLKPEIERSGAVITRDSIPIIMADDIQLVRVFQNLISNAIKYSGGKRPEIHITARRQKVEWVFSVSDNGIGIQEQDKDRIFMLFYRVKRDRNISGNGIGLAICKKIIELHGGRIWVESKPGKGSTFKFTIPVEVRDNGSSINH